MIRPEFYRELLKSEIITLGKPAPGYALPEGLHTVETELKFDLRLLEYKGEPVVGIFSSMKRMTDVIPEEYYKGTGCIRTNFMTFLRAVGTTKTWVLNPGHMRVQILLPHQLEALLDGSIFEKLEMERKTATCPIRQPVPKGTEILVGPPKIFPGALVDKLIEYFLSLQGDIEQAFVGQIHIPSSGLPPHLMLVLKFSDNPKRTIQEINGHIGRTIRSELGEHEVLDLFDLREVSNMPISRLLRFYPK